MAKSSTFKTDKQRLTEAFRALRKRGYFARQSFWCCQSCGCAGVPDEKAEKFVFYHQQDRDNHISEDGMIINGGLHLTWDGDPDIICAELEMAGLLTEHDGSTGTRICVLSGLQ